jgi:hypothetical protein
MPTGEVSGETAAWIAATRAVLGGLIGAVAGAFARYGLDVLRQRREAKVGARLVRLDLTLAGGQMKDAEGTGQGWVFFSTRMDAWTAYQASLVGALKEREFEIVTQSISELERFESDMKQAPLVPGATYRQLSDGSREALRRMRENATAGYNALAKLANASETPGLMHEESVAR